jgi:hypothetical protein
LQTKGPNKQRPKGSVREREKDNVVKSKKIEGEFIYNVSKGKKKSCVKKTFEPIKGCKHPLIASGVHGDVFVCEQYIEAKLLPFL